MFPKKNNVFNVLQFVANDTKRSYSINISIPICNQIVA